MKKLLIIALFLSFFTVPALAERVINSVLLNGGNTAAVVSGDSINVTINVSTYGSGVNDDWWATSYSLDGGATSTCIYTPVADSDGNYTTDFSTDPLPAGNHSISFYAHKNSNCKPASDSNNFKLINSIFVSPAVPIAEYRFDENSWNGSNGEVLDNSGNRLHGRAINSANTEDNFPAKSTNPGTCGYGEFNDELINIINLEGVTVTDNNLLDMSDQFTLSAWIRHQPDINVFEDIILTKGNLFSLNYRLSVQPDGDLRFNWGSGNWLDSHTKIPNNGSWVHIAASYKDGEQVIYINGVADAFRSATSTLNTNNDNLIIGQLSPTLFPFEGNIDEVRIYNRALSADDVDTIYRDSHECPTSSGPYLVAGRVTLNDTAATPQFTHVCFDTPFSSVPAVFSLPTTTSNADRLALRIRNVTESGFDIAQVESPARAGYTPPAGNPPQTVDFLAIETGDYNLDGGAKMRVSTLETQRFQGRFIGGRSWETVSTADLGFTQTPAIIASIQTMANETDPFPISDPFMATAIEDVTRSQFKIALERGETTTGNITSDETIAYLAISSGFIGKLTDKISYESFRTTNSVTGINSCPIYSLDGAYQDGNPLVIASQNSRNGGDGGWLKRCAISKTIVGFSIVEDKASDADTNHINEQAGVLVLGGIFEDFTDTCSTPKIHHYQIEHDGSGLTCAAKPLTIKACLDAACTQLASSDISVSLSATSLSNSTSIWSENPVTIPAGQTAKVTLTHRTAEAVTLRATSLTDPATNPTDYNLLFDDSGYLLTLNNHQSCSTESLTIQAVKLSDDSLSCAPAYTGEQLVNFSFNYSNPNTGTTTPTLAGSPMVKAPAQQNKTVTFDPTGTASLNFNYQDAGKININVSDAAAKGLASATITPVVSPAKLIVKTTQADADCTSTPLANCSAFKKAGEAFKLEVGAACGNGTVTPNFEMAGISLTHALISPNTGNKGNLGFNDVNIVAAPDATLTNINQTISEVGVFTITATPTTNNYLGVTIPAISAATSTNIGRFTPHHFALTSSSVGYKNGGKMSYMGQDNLKLSYILTAQNSAGVTTQNYMGDYVKEDVVIKAENSNDGNNFSTRLSGALPTWANGEYQATGDTWTFKRLAAAVDGPYEKLLIAIGVINKYEFIDDEVPLNDLDIDVSAANDNCTSAGNCTAIKLDSTGTGSIVRFGRAVMENSYGSEAIDLRIPMQTQYWDGSKFITNSEDSFTVVSSALATVSDNKIIPAVPTPTASGSGTFINGESQQLMLKAPGVGKQGSVSVKYDVPAWLQYDWTIIDGSFDEDPSALATFGLYRGNDRIIYRQEVFQ